MVMEIVITEFSQSDWPAVLRIYLEGIATGQATFETAAPSWQEFDAAHHHFGRLAARFKQELIGWAALSPVSLRQCYAGVAEVSIYIAAQYRWHGIGRKLLKTLISESEKQGIWTLQGITFPENTASVRLQQSCGFRIVGERERIAQLHGQWRNTVLTERRSSLIEKDQELAV